MRETGWLLVCVSAAAIAVAQLVAAGKELSGGEHVAPLDDTYIHFQYARSLVDGHPFRYHPSEPPSSGATSPVYIFCLALFLICGWTGPALLIPAQAFGALCYGLAIYCLSALSARLAGAPSRASVVVALAGWGWLAWHAATGMEGALSLALIGWLFLSSHRWVSEARQRTVPKQLTLTALAWLLPLVRPSAVLLCFPIAAVLFAVPRSRNARWLAAAPLLGLFTNRFFWHMVTGTGVPNGAQAKWLLIHPNLSHSDLLEWLWRNVRLLAGYLAGFRVDAVDAYVPPLLFAALVISGLGWLLFRLHAKGHRWWALFPLTVVGILAAMMTYGTYGQHFFRYTTVYAPLLLCPGLAALSRWAQTWEQRRPALRRLKVPLLLPLLAAVPFFFTWPPAVQRYAGACQDIAQQHVVIAGKIRTLPPSSRIGITDAGALAYLGERETVDFIGLTSNGAARFYLSGPGAQLELLEHIPVARRPTHYATYRGSWFHPSEYFGDSVFRAVADNPTIVGGKVLELWDANQTHLGLDQLEGPATGVAPGRLLDSLDIADLHEEQGHHYQFQLSDDRSGHGTVIAAGTNTAEDADFARALEGGRTVSWESFTLRGKRRETLHLVGRLGASTRGKVTVHLRGEEVGHIELMPTSPWTEVVFQLPAARCQLRNRLTIHYENGRTTSFHWWAFVEQAADKAQEGRND